VESKLYGEMDRNRHVGDFLLNRKQRKHKRRRGIRTSTEVENGTGIKEKE
jgi:hypothetical protein